jgi:hypothetical protein
VRLESRAFDGALIRVNEGAFQLNYCVLPAHVRAPAAFAHTARVVGGDAAAADAGEGGRALVAARAAARGDVLYEEQPSFITPTGKGTDVHPSRWRGYLMLRFKGAEYLALQQSFDELTIGDETDSGKRLRMRLHAAQIYDSATEDGASAHAPEEVEMILGVLQRFVSNQFRFTPVAEEGRCAAVAPVHSAVFMFTSNMNHCCEPSVYIEPRACWAPHAPGTCVEGDGRAIARANRDIAPGDALTINYGSKDLPQWPLQQRRRYLLEHNGFWCACAKCLAEEKAAALAPGS